MPQPNEKQKTKIHDDQIVGDVWFSVETYKFFHDGIVKLLHQLKKYETAKETFELEEQPLERIIIHLENMVEWGNQQLAQSSNKWREINPTPSYGSLRLYKAGGLLQIEDYERQKEEYIRNNSPVPKKVIQAIEEKLNRMKNTIELGAMNGLEPADIFVELSKSSQLQTTSSAKVEAVATSQSIPTVLVESDEIPIFDEELRSRCLYLLRTLEDEKDEKKLDIVVREMSVILEERVRIVANISEKLTGADLMSIAFAGNSPKLLFNQDSGIQNAAHLLFRGYNGFVRNEVMHKLVTTFTRGRVYQLLGYIDYLLFLLNRAQRQDIHLEHTLINSDKA